MLGGNSASRLVTSQPRSDALAIIIMEQRGVQCNLVLLSQIKKAKEKRVRATQTVKYDRVKSTQTILLRDGWKEDEKKIGADVATQTDHYNLQGTALEHAIYVLKAAEEFSELSYKIYKDKAGKLKMLITKPSLLGTNFFSGDTIFICLDEAGLLQENVILREEKTVDLTLNGFFDIDQFMEHLKDFFFEDISICEGFQNFTADSELHILPYSVKRHIFPRAHLRSAKCLIVFSAKKMQSKCLHCRQSAQYLKTVLRRKKKLSPCGKSSYQMSHTITESHTVAESLTIAEPPLD